MLHLPFSDLPLKKCPKKGVSVFEYSLTGKDGSGCSSGKAVLADPVLLSVSWKTQGAKGGAWTGGVWNSPISGAEIYFLGPEFSSKISCFADQKQKSSEISGPEITKLRPEIWRIHPSPFQTPHFACLETVPTVPVSGSVLEPPRSSHLQRVHFSRVGWVMYLASHGLRNSCEAWGQEASSCQSWPALLILEPCNPPATSSGFLPCAPRKPHVSAGKRIFLQEKAFFCRKVHFLQESAFFCRKTCFFLFGGVKNHEW